MKTFCKNRPTRVNLRTVRLFVFFMVCVCVYGLTPVAAQYVIDQNFETHALGAVTVSGASRENCAAWSQCNNGVCPDTPLKISGNQAREGSKSLRFEFDKDNWILHGDGYCALRNEIRWNVDLNHGEEAWYGFSMFPALGEDGSVKYNSNGDAWICQLKNECASGNRGGLQVKGDNFHFGGNNLATVNYNQWNDIVIHYKYHSSEGFRRIWINGVQVLSQNFNTATTSCKIDFKIGMYGWQPYGKSIIYFDAIKVKIGSGSYNDVAPAQQPSVAVTSVTVNPANAAIYERETVALTETVLPSDATNKAVVWSSNNDQVATVSSSGIVTGIAEGTATISVITQDGNKAATCVVNVGNAGINVALAKAVTASSYQDNTDGVFPAKNLVDGNPADSSRWAADGFPQWVEIDLGSTYDITRFEVYTFQNRAYHYTIEVKPDGGSYSTVVDRSNNTLGGFIADDNAAIGRYVKLTVTGASNYTGSWVSITELMVYGKERLSTGVNHNTTVPPHKRDGEVDIRTMQGKLVIDIRAFSMSADVSVYDILGKCVYQKMHAPGVFNINYTVLGTASMYIVKIDNKATSVTRVFDIAR